MDDDFDIDQETGDISFDNEISFRNNSRLSKTLVRIHPTDDVTKYVYVCMYVCMYAIKYSFN